MHINDKKQIANELNYLQIKLGMLRADLFRSAYEVESQMVKDHITEIEKRIDQLQNMLIAAKEGGEHA